MVYGLGPRPRPPTGQGRDRPVVHDFHGLYGSHDRAASDAPGPGQEMAIQIIELAQHVVEQGNSITVKWTPAHRG